MKRTGFILLTLVLCLPLVVLAQPGDPGGGGDPDVPITGIEILLAIGGFLGLRKFLNSKKENK